MSYNNNHTHNILSGNIVRSDTTIFVFMSSRVIVSLVENNFHHHICCLTKKLIIPLNLTDSQF